MTFYKALKQQRKDVFKAYPDTEAGALAWWIENGQFELWYQLGQLDRKDVRQNIGARNLMEWYVKHGVKEYENIWKSPRKIDNGSDTQDNLNNFYKLADEQRNR